MPTPAKLNEPNYAERPARLWTDGQVAYRTTNTV